MKKQINTRQVYIYVNCSLQKKRNKNDTSIDNKERTKLFHYERLLLKEKNKNVTKGEWEKILIKR